MVDGPELVSGEPREVQIDLPAGRFRALEWPGREPAVVLLHGLTATANAWSLVAAELQGGRRLIALDQRGHGDSPSPETGYGIGGFVADLCGLLEGLELGRPHLAGHSMGARVAMVAGGRPPLRFRSTAVVDIGPEAWAQNWRDTVAAIDRMPASFTEDEAIAFLTRNRSTPPERLAQLMERVQQGPAGRYTWRGSPAAWKQAVRSHRSRSFWPEWERLRPPALLVRGGTSPELRESVAAEMRRRNPAVEYEEFDAIGHNIPVLAPERLAQTLEAFWADAERRAG